MECALREDDSDDGAARPKARGARPSGFGVLDREITRNVAVDGTLPGAAASLCRPTTLPATEKVCRIVDLDLASLEIRMTAGLGGGRLRFALSESDCVLRTKQGVHADASFRTGVPSLSQCAGDPAVLEKSTASAGAHRFVTPRIPHRPLKDLPDQAAPRTVERGTPFGDWPRDWDNAIWPNTNAGLFKAEQDMLRGPEKARTA